MIIPAVVHWKAGHYAALVRELNGRYLIQDPTFGDEIWVDRAALDEEASGYFLVPDQPLPDGWEAVNATEGDTVWGKGNTGSSDPNRVTPNDRKDPNNDYCNGRGMAYYNIHSLLVSLNIVDTPVGYTPPRGPAVQFTLTYNQRDAGQPSIFSYSNLGPKWTILPIQRPRPNYMREEVALSLIPILIAQPRVMLSNQTVIPSWSERLRPVMRGDLPTAQKKSTTYRMVPFHFRARSF